MRYLSLFSGIEAASEAWSPLGWQCVAVAEIEPFPCSVLAAHHSGAPNLGDVTKINETMIASLGPIDLVVFGSPCQDLSVAGKRAGLQGERSGLFHQAIRILGYARKHCGTRFAVWENVPGAFSSNKGRDFAVVVGELAGVAGLNPPPKGWGTEGCLLGEQGMVEWSVLDAQWFGVAQRRRRVFAFADFGDWRGRCPVLLEPESLRGNSAPSREAGQDVAPTIRAGATSSSAGHGARSGDSKDELIVATGDVVGVADVAHRLNAGGMRRIDYESETLVTHALRADGFDASEDGTGRGTPLIAFNHNAQVDQMNFSSTTLPALSCSQGPAVLNSLRVRRLTPIECERLQGFRDRYTLITHKKKSAADGPRYKALGNSMAVPVMRWIGRRIDLAVRFFS